VVGQKTPFYKPSEFKLFPIKKCYRIDQIRSSSPTGQIQTPCLVIDPQNLGSGMRGVVRAAWAASNFRRGLALAARSSRRGLGSAGKFGIKFGFWFDAWDIIWYNPYNFITSNKI
jgi:hypothetical protein